MRIFSASAKACHTGTASTKQYGNRTIKNGTPDASAYKNRENFT
jgi:hypothetical protein